MDVAGIYQYMIKFRMFGELYVDDVRLFQNQQTINIFKINFMIEMNFCLSRFIFIEINFGLHFVNT